MRKIVTLFLAAVLLLSAVVFIAPKADAAGAYTFRLAGTDGSSVVSAKPGDTVKLILSVENNPGVLSVGVNVKYPSGLSMASQPADVSGFSSVATVYKTFSPSQSSNPYLLWWNMPLGASGKKLVTKAGNVAEITFNVASNAQPGDYSITLTAPRDKNLTASTSGGVITAGTNKDVSGITLVNCTVRVATACPQGHSYGSWSDAGDGNHSRTCSVCSATDSASHTWNSGSVTKQATCAEAGVKTYLCADCKTTKTEPIPKLNEHTYDNTCDPDCSVCGYVRQTAHAYDVVWSSDATGHWYACTKCGDKTEFAQHAAGMSGDETVAQNCYICGYDMLASPSETEPVSTDATAPSAQNTGANKVLLWVALIVFMAVAVTISAMLIIRRKQR